MNREIIFLRVTFFWQNLKQTQTSKKGKRNLKVYFSFVFVQMGPKGVQKTKIKKIKGGVVKLGVMGG